LRSLLNASDTGVVAGMPPTFFHRFCFWTITDKLPSVGSKCSKLFLNLEKRSRVANGRFNFHSVSNDVRVLEQFGDALVRISRYLLRIKIAKCSAILFALVEDYKPVEAGLGTLKARNSKCLRSSCAGTPPHDRDITKGLPGTAQAHRVRASFVLAGPKTLALLCC
jgi:hypothetical protein